MKKVNLSIVIVNYKSWKVLANCLDSFSQYTPKLNYEIIVVDNDSQDGKIELFSQNYPQITFIKNSGNNGFSNGCNLGADNAHGEFLLFLNPDTVLINNTAIDDMFEFAKNNLDIGITSCRKINPKGAPEREVVFDNIWLLIIRWVRMLYKFINKSKIQKKFPNDDDIWHPDWVAGSVVLIQAKLFIQSGKWSQEKFWMYYEDLDLCMRVKKQNKGIALLRNVELKHIHGGSSRISPNITAVAKSELIASRHTYIQLYTSGFNRIALHFVTLAVALLSQFLKTAFALLMFWRPIFKVNFLVLISTLNYYFSAFFRLNWTSKRIIK